MLMRFSVENYRGFKNRVELDLSKVRNYTFHSEYIRDGIVNKCMVVGRNGCGKTDFGLAMFDVVSVLTDYRIDMKQKDRFGFLNGDSDQPYATFRYVFKHGGSEIEYEYRKTDPDNIVYERMSIDDTLIFMRDGNLIDHSGLKDYGAGNLRMDIGDGPLSVLRYVANNTNQSKDSPITGIMGFVKGMLHVGSIQEGNGYIGLTRVSDVTSTPISCNFLISFNF